MSAQRRSPADDGPLRQKIGIVGAGMVGSASAFAMVIAGGVAQKPGETRLQLLQRNADVFRQIVPSVLQSAPDALLLIVTNPVDIMTDVAGQFASDYGVAASRVLRLGTTLNSGKGVRSDDR